ncbi:hypothetical protein ASG22_10730 [Chryseobacterium sp. Leaf405]|uniref:hypothetical protein n=1 Tax=Chryseobacterium sp. Leaf405 TaxID=1736367 RepID=UPI0007004879|nr:hypothetical protein [Chryseobacterium sp. Leaf405]KQT24471.1 hypothetical protein ASG22_10730 [Chryseobacterium sp. Leaf405]
MQNIDWETIYSVVLYVVKNYPLKIILYSTIFLVFGFVISFILIFSLRKVNAISREHKYYNWLVKLYIPLILIVNIIFSLKIGLFVGVYKSLKQDSYVISEQVYISSSQYIFKDQQSKAEFVADLKTIVSALSQNNKNIKFQIVDIAKVYDTKYKLMNKPKNWLASLFADKYGDRIHTLILYEILNSIPNVEVTRDLSYEEFDTITQKLLQLNPDDLEKSIVEKIQNLFLMVLKSQFKVILKGILLIWGLLMLIPWIEFWMYKYVMKRRMKKQQSKI